MCGLGTCARTLRVVGVRNVEIFVSVTADVDIPRQKLDAKKKN